MGELKMTYEGRSLYNSVVSRGSRFNFRDAMEHYKYVCWEYGEIKRRLRNPVNKKNGKPLAESYVRTMTLRAKTWPTRRDGLLVALRELISAGYDKPRIPSNVIDLSEYRWRRYAIDRRNQGVANV